MSDQRNISGSKPPLKFAKTRGSLLTGRHKEKGERIREAMSDLQLAIRGCSAQLAQPMQPGQFGQTVAAFARASSIFLRKVAIGDRNERKTRLLDDDICQAAALSFHRIQKLAGPRRLLNISLNISGGHMQLVKLDDHTLLPQHVYNLPIGPQGFDLSIAWPLPGMASWTEQPTCQDPWRIGAESLFETQSRSRLNCDGWLGQQLVVFDDKGVALKEVIRTTTNTEGAHSLNVSRLMTTENEGESKAAQSPEIHILSNISVFGVKYNHVIVIECALYLYKTLAQNEFFQRPSGDIEIPTFCIVPELQGDVFSSYQGWLAYDGGLIVSFGGERQPISHRVRAPR